MITELSTSPGNHLTHQRPGTYGQVIDHGRAEARFMLGEVHVASDVTFARLHGDLDLVTVDALRDLLDDICAGSSSQIVIDLCEVAFVDVLSLSVILGTADALREVGRQLTVEGASNSVRKLCALLNAEDILAPEHPLTRTAV
jgi:anti-anti-sigma factor